MAIDPTIMAALISAGGVTASGLFAWWRTRPHDAAQMANLEASAMSANADATLKLIPALTKRIGDLESKLIANESMMGQLRTEHSDERVQWAAQLQVRDTAISEMRTEMDEFRGGVTVLIAQLEENKITPRWKPRARTGPLDKS